MRLFPVVYDAAMAAAERGLVGRLRRGMAAGARGRVLEIGAGTGLDFPHYPPGAWVVATDPDCAMLRRARPRARAADAEALPFRDPAFNAGMVGLAMCTIPRLDRALAELCRTVRPGGALELHEHVRVEQPLIGRVQDWLTPLWPGVAGGCRLNQWTAAAVTTVGFVVRYIESRLGGFLQRITARRSPHP